MAAPFIDPDLREETMFENLGKANDKYEAAMAMQPEAFRRASGDNHKESTETTSNATNDGDNNDKGNDDKDEHQQDRPQRQTTPRQFLLPGTHSKHVQSQLPGDFSKHELDIRKQQYSNLCLDNLTEQDEAIFLMNCMEASVDEETILLKELELLTACAISDGDEEILMPIITTSI